MLSKKLDFLNEIDQNAKNLAEEFSKGQSITSDVMKIIISLYESAKVEKEFKNEHFDSAYHSPITGNFEFFIARILYHYSNVKNLDWKILLRKQEKKAAPDIRIVKNNTNIAVIEIKAKAGWIQSVFSEERYNYDKKRLDLGKSKTDPDEINQKFKGQLTKYCNAFNLELNDIYLLLPTLEHVYRKKYKADLGDYYSYFAKVSELKSDNFILLSENKTLDLSNPKNQDFQPTQKFENMLIKLSKK